MRHAPALRRGHSAFLSVSVSAGSHNRADLQAVDEVVQGFLYELGWHPDCIEHVAGACASLSAIGRPRGSACWDLLSAEPTRETELTDWAKLDAFIASFAAQMKGLRSA